MAAASILPTFDVASVEFEKVGMEAVATAVRRAAWVTGLFTLTGYLPGPGTDSGSSSQARPTWRFMWLVLSPPGAS